MQATDFFAADYASARGKFRDAVTSAGLAFTEYRHPGRGPRGEALSTDAVWIGPRSARRLLLGMSATHGVEGFCGSGCQTGWLRTGALERLPADTAALLIHAINPYGFAWQRRVNEDNVDLNRNFVRHGAAYPENPGYRELRPAICPPEWTAASRAAADAVLYAYAAEHGAMALQGAISAGQYFDAEGIFYGGSSPVWSHRTLAAILAEHGSHVRQVGCDRSPHRARALRDRRDHRSPRRGRAGTRAHQGMVRRRGDLARERDLELGQGERGHQPRHRERTPQGGRRLRRPRVRHAPAQGHARQPARRQLAPRPRQARVRARVARSRPRSARPSIRTRTTGRTWSSNARST